MMPTDAIAIVTPHGRYERVSRNPKEMLPCGHTTDMYEIAWNGDTKTPADGELPSLVCNSCMKNWIAALVASVRKETT